MQQNLNSDSQLLKAVFPEFLFEIIRISQPVDNFYSESRPLFLLDSQVTVFKLVKSGTRPENPIVHP